MGNVPHKCWSHLLIAVFCGKTIIYMYNGKMLLVTTHIIRGEGLLPRKAYLYSIAI